MYAFYENGELVTLNLRGEAIERTRLADKSQHEDSFPLFSEKGSFLIVRDIENGVRIYDYQKREFLTEWIHFDRFTLIAVFESPFGKSVVRGVVNGHGVIFYDGVKLIGVDHLDSLSTYRTDSHVSVVLNTYHQTILNVITTISKPFTSLIFLMESPLPLVDQGFGEINDGRGSFFFQDKDDFIFVLSPNHLLQLFNLQGDCLKKIQFERLFQDEQVEKMTVQGNLIYSQTVRISKSHFGEKVKRIIIHSPSGRCLASLPMDSSDHLERIQVVGTRIFLLMKNSRPGPRIQVFKFSKK